MADRRAKDVDWNVRDSDGSTTWERVQVAVLMDLRDQLKAIRHRLDCWEVLEIPRTLKAIRRNTAKPRKKKK